MIFFLLLPDIELVIIFLVLLVGHPLAKPFFLYLLSLLLPLFSIRVIFLFFNLHIIQCNESHNAIYVRSKSMRCYVGGFKSSITENLLCNYVQRRGVFVSWLNIRRYPDQNRAVIQINVDGERGASLFEEGFWPEGVQCRPWYPRNAYRRKLQTRSYQAADRETYDNVYVVNDDTSIHSFMRNID